MIKEIKYRGYTAVPSDYESSDGELSTAINLIPEDGDLKIINQPVTLQSLAPYDCLCIHKAGNKDWLILYSEHEYPGEDKVGEIYSLQKGSNQEPSIIVSGFQEKPSVAILGNTLVISDGTTTAYILYSVDHENYIYLGNSLPEISPNLALSYEPQADDSYLKAVTIGIPEGYSTEAILKIFTVFSNYALL